VTRLRHLLSWGTGRDKTVRGAKSDPSRAGPVPLRRGREDVAGASPGLSLCPLTEQHRSDTLILMEPASTILTYRLSKRDLVTELGIFASDDSEISVIGNGEEVTIIIRRDKKKKKTPPIQYGGTGSTSTNWNDKFGGGGGSGS
jgi:hypothetical protein